MNLRTTISLYAEGTSEGACKRHKTLGHKTGPGCGGADERIPRKDTMSRMSYDELPRAVRSMILIDRATWDAAGEGERLDRMEEVGIRLKAPKEAGRKEEPLKSKGKGHLKVTIFRDGRPMFERRFSSKRKADSWWNKNKNTKKFERFEYDEYNERTGEKVF